MDDGSDRSIEFRNLLARAAAEEPGAFDALAIHASGRLRALAHRMLARYPHVRRWEETDDVFQAALIRLHRSLSDVKPDSTRAFFGLAITQIRRTLIDLSRHYFGAHGDGAHHHTDGGGRAADDVGGPLHQAPESEEPGTIGQWTAFHEAIETLPEEVRETFSLVWYGGLAANLVRDGLLTAYQASVLLKGGNDPLLLDRYVILEAIGSGGMGVVYKARHVSMDRIVALKVLPRSLEDASRTIRRFQREIKATARLSHPNIVTALDAHDADGTHFLVMEYVDGRNLMEVVRDRGPLPIEESVGIIMQIADALAEAHRKGVVHRDIKPSNILLQPDGQAKLLDLGLARISRLNADDITISALTQDGLAMGTEAFMPPEQARDSKTADARSDIYSLGCTLFYLVTGRPLFVKRTPVLTMVAHREEPPASLREFREDAPETLDALFRQMVSKSPGDRPQSMVEVVDSLSPLLRSAQRNPAAAKSVVDSRTQRRDDSANRSADNHAPIRPWPIVGWLALVLVLVVVVLVTHQYLTIRPKRDAAQWIKQTGGTFAGSTIDGSELYDLPASPLDSFNIERVEWLQDPPNTLEPLRHFPNIRRLNISGMSLETSEFESLSGFTQLQWLDLSNCKLSDSDLEALANLDQLEGLDLARNPIGDAGLERLAKLSALFTLDVSDTLVTAEGARKIGRFRKLFSLWLRGTNLDGDGVEELGSLRELRWLDISRTGLTDEHAGFLGELSLEGLLMDDCAITDKSAALIARSRELEILSLSRATVTAKGLRLIAKLPEVKRLILAGIKVSPESIDAIASMSTLEELDLSETNLDATWLTKLGRLSSLSRLMVEGTPVTSAAASEFMAAHPRCAVIAD